MKIGKKIAALRNKKGLSQEELANRLYVSRQTISKWENDVVLPDANNLKELSKLFECSIDEILSEEEIKNDNQIVEAMEYGGRVVKRHWQKIGYYLIFIGAVCLLFRFVADGMFGSFTSNFSMFGDDSLMNTQSNAVSYFLMFPTIVGAALLIGGIILVIIDFKKRRAES